MRLSPERPGTWHLQPVQRYCGPIMHGTDALTVALGCPSHCSEGDSNPVKALMRLAIKGTTGPSKLWAA